MPFQYGLFVSPSSLPHRIVIVSAVIAASIRMSVLLEFVCFQVPTKFAGCSVMCEWWLAHSGVSDVLDGGFDGYVPVAACTLRGGLGAWLVVGLWVWLFSAVVVVWECRPVGYV